MSTLRSIAPVQGFSQVPQLPVKQIRFGSGSDRLGTSPNSKFKFELKMKKSQKYFKVCVESNGIKNFKIFVHSVYFAGIISSTKTG
jgi:hypothetical protein